MEKCLSKSIFSIIMPKRCSNPEIRAEYSGISAPEQVNDKVTPASLPVMTIDTKVPLIFR